MADTPVMPTPTPPPRGPESPLAALRLAYPSWRIRQADNGEWVATGAGRVLRGKTMPALAVKLREAHARRWGVASSPELLTRRDRPA